MNIETRHIGIIIIAMSVAFIFVLIPLTFRLAENELSQCIHQPGYQCSIIGHIPYESYAGFGIAIILAGMGSFLAFKAHRTEKMSAEMKVKFKEAVKFLKGDEKKVYEIVADSRGALFQSDVVERSGFSKVKVTRILDKLEGKGLIERRRRGMTNMVLLKYS